MTGKQILIVEDEKPIRDMVAFGLRRAGYEVREAEDCSSARAQIADRRPDVLLVDWMLPDQSGLELVRSVKRHKDTADLPVIMLTARADEADKVTGLEGGADDYVTKPFSPRELLARIRALLRRADGRAEPAYAWGDVRIVPATREVTLRGQPVRVVERGARIVDRARPDHHQQPVIAAANDAEREAWVRAVGHLSRQLSPDAVHGDQSADRRGRQHRPQCLRRAGGGTGTARPRARALRPAAAGALQAG